MQRALRIAVLIVFAAAVSLMLFSSCGGKGATQLLVVAEADTDSGETIVVVIIQEEDGMPVEDATVTVNSVTIPHVKYGIYTSTITTVNEGGTVSLDVQRGGISVSGAVTMPDQPSVTAPTTAGGPYSRSSSLAVTWVALAPVPDQVFVRVDYKFTVDPYGYNEFLNGSATLTSIPNATFNSTTTTDVTVEVGGANSTSLTGSDIVSGSTLIAANIDSSEPFITSP